MGKGIMGAVIVRFISGTLGNAVLCHARTVIFLTCTRTVTPLGCISLSALIALATGGDAMRKITREVVGAFVRGECKRLGSTVASGTVLWLHGNAIARYRDNADGLGDVEVTLAGWPTRTTRDRLNAIPGVSVCQRNGWQYLNGCQIHINEWYPVKVAEYLFAKALQHGD